MTSANPDYRVLVSFESCELRFRLSNLDNIKPAWEKELKALTFPEVIVSALKESIDASAKGVVLVDYMSWLSNHLYDGAQTPKCLLHIRAPRDDGLNFSGDEPATQSDPTGHFEITYSPTDKSVLVKLNGTFDCGFHYDEFKLAVFKNAKFLYFNRFLLKDAKGENITVNNEDGIEFPLEAYSDINEDKKLYQVPVKIKFVTK